MSFSLAKTAPLAARLLAVSLVGLIGCAPPPLVRRGWSYDDGPQRLVDLGPAALGEIGRHNLSVVAPIVPMFCGFLEEPFSRGPMLWGLGRLAAVHPGELDEVRPFILPCLADDDPQVRGLTVWVLGRLREPEARDRLKNLLGDESPVELYDQGELRRSSVAQLAREALAALE